MNLTVAELNLKSVKFFWFAMTFESTVPEGNIGCVSKIVSLVQRSHIALLIVYFARSALQRLFPLQIIFYTSDNHLSVFF